MTADPFTILRVEDMLLLHVSVINLERDGSRLVRENADEPAVLLFALPPQHVGESDVRGAFPPTVPAVSAGTSRLALLLPDGEDGIDLASEALLAWELLQNTSVPVSIPPDDGEISVFSGLPRTAIEFPARLLLGTEGDSGWSFAHGPVSEDGHAPLWRAALTRQDGAEGLLKAFAAFTDTPQRISSPISDDNLRDLIKVTSAGELIFNGVPVEGFQREPLRAERFILTPLGACVRMSGDFAPLPGISLQGYHHEAELGRDQYVRVVERGFLSSGHAAVRTKTAKRRFVAQGDGTVVAYLVREDRITVTQPEQTYGEGVDYHHVGQSMPFAALRITDTITPPLAPADNTHRVKLEGSGEPFRFTVVGTDSEQRHVTFTMPLMFFTLNEVSSVDVAGIYGSAPEDFRRVTLQGQTMALTPLPDGVESGATSMPVGSLTFTMAPVSGHPLGALPEMQLATARVHAVEQLTGSPAERQVALRRDYVANGFAAAGPSSAFLDLVDPLAVSFAAEKAGGLAQPSSVVQAITAKAGLLPQDFAGAANAVSVDQLQRIFGDAKLLGSVDLFKLLEPVAPAGINGLAQLTGPHADEIIADRLARGLLPVPILRARELANGRELRYLWTPALHQGRTPLVPGADFAAINLKNASLTLEATTVCTPDAAQKSTVRGVLTGFGLDFAGLLTVDFGRIEFVTKPGSRPVLNASGLQVGFKSALEFINTLKELLPKDGFGKGAYVDVDQSGIKAGYTLAVPAVQFGAFSLSNVTLGAELRIPLDDRQVVTFRFSVAERFHPFNLSVGIFGGGGFFSLTVSPAGIQLIEGSLEFGGNTSLDLGVASGGVHLMAGIYFAYSDQAVQLTGYLRCGGYLSVLGLVSVSVEFYLKLTYVKSGNRTEVYGEGTLTVSVKVAFFSKSVSLGLQRRFGGSGDPSFADCVKPGHWDTYCLAFAP
ncbi:hypothetical protein ACIRPU_42805 [Streptomyces sp. NPDC102259]|uniref:hypothetical protein n=1 Tax=Streptomyces sp. NPDC102259 TaxID=3366148 RepID=UPI003820C5EC